MTHLKNRKKVIDLFNTIKIDYPELKQTKLHFVSPRHTKNIAGTSALISGCYNSSKNIIYIVSFEGWFWDCITLVHEIAHAIVYQRYNICGHGSEWQKIANDLYVPIFDIEHHSESIITNQMKKRFDCSKFIKKYNLYKK